MPRASSRESIKSFQAFDTCPYFLLPISFKLVASWEMLAAYHKR